MGEVIPFVRKDEIIGVYYDRDEIVFTQSNKQTIVTQESIEAVVFDNAPLNTISEEALKLMLTDYYYLVSEEGEWDEE